MIQCIGPAERYCSRICCTTALKNALAVKQDHPETQVTILYRDIRVFGLKEQLYTKARREGVLFVRYDDDHPPQLIEEGEGNPPSQPLTIRVRERKLNAYLDLQADLLVLSLPMIPSSESRELANLFKISLGAEGYFMEAHVKLRPVDFATEGVFMAGMAHYPKLLDESMIQAQAAASRAAIVLSKDHLKAGGRVAQVDQQKCTGCLTCLRICPFEVPVIQAEAAGIGRLQGAAYIEPAVCQGCGSCAAECPAKAIELMHFTDLQLQAKAQALLHPELPQEIVKVADQQDWKNSVPDYPNPCKETAS
jgi:heterodisulfide reductase subunit A-like polyferredoxin